MNTAIVTSSGDRVEGEEVRVEGGPSDSLVENIVSGFALGLMTPPEEVTVKTEHGDYFTGSRAND